MRELTAQAFHNLTPISQDKMVKDVLPKLVKVLDGMDLFMKHGAICAIGAIVKAFGEIAKSKKIKLAQILGTVKMGEKCILDLKIVRYSAFTTCR